jgi:DNA (cytosine-5)-methyltransferase 1
MALKKLGQECVFACEVDEDLAALYETNFGLRPHGDIRTLDISKVPAHDILCAGFPCQPFSNAGGQEGLECPQWGDLIEYVIAILRRHKPQYFIIENVPNLVRHRQGKTWRTIEHRLRLAGYSVDDGLLSPHQIGVPQIRERAFIVGRRGGLDGFEWPKPAKDVKLSIESILDEEPEGARPLPKQFLTYLRAWQKFLDRFPTDEQLPSFPIWAMEFGATYPYEVVQELLERQTQFH